MDFLKQLGDTVSQKGIEVGHKAKEVSETMSLSMELQKKQSALEKQYFEIGVQYYQKHKEDEEPEFLQMHRVRELEEECSRLREQIADKKGKEVCPNCGEYVERGHKFCPNCGTSLNEFED